MGKATFLLTAWEQIVELMCTSIQLTIIQKHDLKCTMNHVESVYKVAILSS